MLTSRISEGKKLNFKSPVCVGTSHTWIWVWYYIVKVL